MVGRLTRGSATVPHWLSFTRRERLKDGVGSMETERASCSFSLVHEAGGGGQTWLRSHRRLG